MTQKELVEKELLIKECNKILRLIEQNEKEIEQSHDLIKQVLNEERETFRTQLGYKCDFNIRKDLLIEFLENHINDLEVDNDEARDIFGSM